MSSGSNVFVTSVDEFGSKERVKLWFCDHGCPNVTQVTVWHMPCPTGQHQLLTHKMIPPTTWKKLDVISNNDGIWKMDGRKKTHYWIGGWSLQHTQVIHRFIKVVRDLESLMCFRTRLLAMYSIPVYQYTSIPSFNLTQSIYRSVTY